MKYIYILLLLLSNNSYACCDCAIVDVSMDMLSNTFDKSLEQYDETSSKIYENNVLSEINKSLVNLNTNFTALKNNTIIESMNSECVDEINHQIKKSIELKSISKTQEAIINFDYK